MTKQNLILLPASVIDKVVCRDKTEGKSTWRSRKDKLSYIYHLGRALRQEVGVSLVIDHARNVITITTDHFTLEAFYAIDLSSYSN